MRNSLFIIKAQGTRRFLSVSLCLLCFFVARGQESEGDTGLAGRTTETLQKVITTTKSVGIGYNSMQDTYLSPEHYGGMELRYVSHTLRENGRSPFTGKQGNGDWTRLIINEGFVSQGKSRSGNGSTIGGTYHFQYGILHRKHLFEDRLVLQGGSALEFLGGFLYNTRNGNNPAQVRAMINLGVVAHADYAVGKNRRMHIIYEPSVPLLGLAFSPNYGQSYYEIGQGSYDRNAVPTTVFCMPSLRHSLTCNFSVAGLDISAGYLGDYRQQSVNGLKQHVYSHNIIIGVVKKLKL